MTAPALVERLRHCAQAALAAGNLQPLTTRIEHCRDGGFDFVIHVTDGGAERQKPRHGGDGDNPFLDPDPALVVGEVSPTHRLLLNKFAVIDCHALVVTREFEDQCTPLTLADFDALARCLAQLDGLVFYNAGRNAGASQRHRHLQLVPLPLPGHGRRLVFEPPDVPFRHAARRFASPLPAAMEWLKAYDALRGELGVDGADYNLLATRQWLMLVPRPREKHAGIGVNAIGFAGSVLARAGQELDTLRRIGPVALLRGVSDP